MQLKKKNYLLKKLKAILEEINTVDVGCIIDSGAEVFGSELFGKVEISMGCKIFKTHLSGNVKVGRYTSIWGPNIYINSHKNSIIIGSFCSIARNATIIEYNHYYSRLSTYFMNKNILQKKMADDIITKGSILIGNDVWIGTGAVILSGVNIGNGAVVGANSVVTQNIPPYAIVGGIPAKIIKYRFENEIVNILEDLKWWEWDIERIKKNDELFKLEISTKDFFDVIK